MMDTSDATLYCEDYKAASALGGIFPIFVFLWSPTGFFVMYCESSCMRKLMNFMVIGMVLSALGFVIIGCLAFFSDDGKACLEDYANVNGPTATT